MDGLLALSTEPQKFRTRPERELVRNLPVEVLRPAVLLIVAFFAAGCGSHDVLSDAFGPDGRTIREAIAAFPSEQREVFALMERRCTRCHTLNEPFAALVPDGSWRSQIRKMERKAGAGLPSEDADRIAAFMEYFSERRRAARR